MQGLSLGDVVKETDFDQTVKLTRLPNAGGVPEACFEAGFRP